MKRFLFGFLAVLFLILNTIPYLHILADDMPTSSQYEMLGAYALSTLITSGEATELDFSDYTETDTSFLIDLGEAIFTGDWSGLAEDGLEWLGETADSIYDSYKEYVSQWKSDHLGIMYSNWFPDETIYVGPDDSYNLAKPLRELLTPRANSNNPQPDPNYQIFLDYINKRDSSVHNSFFFYNFPKDNGRYHLEASIYPFTNFTWVYYGGPNSYDFTGSYTYCAPCSIQNINITSSNGVYSINQYLDGIQGFCYEDYVGYYNTLSVQQSGWSCGGYRYGNNTVNIHLTSSGTLEQVFNYLIRYIKNVNIYVDNQPWALVTSDTPTYPIVIPGQLTIYNNQPLEYSFPSDTHIDLPDLTSIIRNAINSSGVVMWSDIADVFVDVNGLTAVAVTKIVRNDYDNLYMEQYPYPAMLIGMTDQTKFNEHLLDNSHAYLSPINTVVQETVSVLPSELVGVLAIGAILTIFAVIINRLLE